MKIGVLGAGRMGAYRARALSDSGQVETVLLGNRTIKNAKAAAVRPNIVPMSIDEVFEAEVDAYVVAVATAAHGNLLERCVATRRPVLCEKPISDDLGETIRLVTLAKQSGTEIQVGFMRRHDQGFRAAREAVQSGRAGTVYCVRILSHDHEVSPTEFIRTSGGIFRDLMVHDFDIVRWITGSEFATVYASGAVRKHERFQRYGDFDTCLIQAELNNGVLVTMSGCRHNPLGYDFRLEVLGSDDSIAVGLGRRTPITTPDDPGLLNQNPYRGFLDRFAASFDAEVKAFVELVSGAGPNVVPAESAVESLRVAIASEKSARAGRPVRVSEIEGTG